MKIVLNGTETDAAPDVTVATLLTEKGITAEKIAVAVGTKVIPRAQWQTTPLQENDKITIISAVRGG
ncbi:MAG: sulfur carrier protein ThiS [Bacteroidales bacterium]|nr:sulfur carrier protein ThiS [Bacteroidales bacterium]